MIKVEEFFAKVNVVIPKLQKYDVTISQQELCQHDLCGLSPRFPADVNYFERRERFE